MYDQSKLFGKPGFITIREYLEDIDSMRRHGPWKLPLRLIDRLQLVWLRMLSKLSWFSESLFIAHPSPVSPAYAILLAYVFKQGFFETFGKKNMQYGNAHIYFFEKQITINGRTYLINGQGANENQAIACSKAFGEILERMISGVADQNKNIVSFSPQSLAQKKLPFFYPPRYHRFLEIQKEQFPRLRHDETDSLEWVIGKNLITGEPTYIPRQMTSWFLGGRVDKKLLVNLTTNGSAGYFSEEGAVLRGLLEGVQRDGFLVHWLTMIAPPLIRNETLPNEIMEKIRILESQGINVFVLNVTTLSLPSVIVALVSEQSETPQVVLSGGAALTLKEALSEAMREIMAGLDMFYWSDKQAETLITKEKDKPFISRLGKVERQLYWRGKEKVAQFRWFVSGEKISYEEAAQLDISSGADDASKLKKCLEILSQKGKEYFPIVYFPKHQAEQTLGYYIAQVYIPKAFPFYLVEHYGTFDSDRLHEFAHSRGKEEWKLNHYPHMFS